MSSEPVIQAAGEGKILSMGVRYLVTGDNSAHTSMFEITLPVGYATGLHVHSAHEETFYVIDGECEWQIGDRTMRAKPGAFVFIPPKVHHNITNCGDRPLKVLFTASPPGHEGYFDELSALLSQDGPPNADAIERLRTRYDTVQLSELRRGGNGKPAS